MKKKLFSAFLALLITLLYCSTFVAAAISYVDLDKDFKYTFRLPAGLYGSESNHYTSLTVIRMDSDISYCLNPYILSENGRNYGAGSDSYSIIPARLHNLNATKQKNIELATIYGWELSAKSKADAFYTKIYVGQEATDMEIIAASGPGVSLAGYNNWKAAILKKINSYLKEDPSFHGSRHEITVGGSLALTDTNAILNEYTVTDLPAGLSATISGNKLNLTATKDFAGGTVRLNRLQQYQGISRFYFVTIPGGIWRQPIITAGIPTPKVATVSLDSVPATGVFRLKKTDDAGAELSGAQFNLKNSKGNTVLNFTLNSGTYSSPQLEEGIYTLTETKAPRGYVLDSTPRQIQIKGGETNNIYYTTPLKNMPQQIKIRIAKTGEDQKPLVGASFEIRQDQKEIMRITTDQRGIAESTPLPQGKYTVSEVKAPPGYTPTQETNVTLSGDESGSASLTQEIKISNEQTHTEISKKDATTGEELPGATLTLKEKETTELIETWVSTEQPHIIRGLHQDKTYVLTEDTAPLGYSLCQDVEFTIDGKNSVTNKVEMIDELTVTEISKKDAITGEELPGATLTLKEKETGEPVETWVSTEQPHIIRGLYQGKTYVLTEDLAPLGYALCQDVKFTVNGAHGVTNKVEMIDKLTVTEISKKDATTGEELPGATLTLKERETGEPVETWVSTEQPHIIRGLHQGKTYVLTEDLAPLGYALCQDVEFTVDGAHGVTNKAEMIDKLTFTEISKKDATTGEELPGATLTLKERETGEPVETWVSTEQPHIIKGLHQDKTYVLTEDLAPLGYALCQDVEFIIDGAHGVTNKVEMTDELTLTEISKKDATTGEELPGATLTLKERETGEPVETWTSTEQPHIIRGLHQGKTYILTEDTAPLGYSLCQDVEFTIDGKNSVTNKVEMTDELTVTEISKKDTTTGEELPGAKLTLKEKESGELVETWTSTEQPHIIRGLHQDKTYVLIEDTAPAGYQIAKPVEFTVDGSTAYINFVEIGNEKEPEIVATPLPTTGERPASEIGIILSMLGIIVIFLGYSIRRIWL
ncbi:MAG: MSCRAMM family protein [Saccharofermentanales bacterium]